MKKSFTKFLMATAFCGLVAGSFIACESSKDDDNPQGAPTENNNVITVRDEVFPIEEATIFDNEQMDSIRNLWSHSISFIATTSNKNYQHPGRTFCTVDLFAVGEEIVSGVYPIKNVYQDTSITRAGRISIRTHEGGMADDSSRIACCWRPVEGDNAISVTNLGGGRYKIAITACEGEMYCGAEDGSMERGTASLKYEGKLKLHGELH